MDDDAAGVGPVTDHRAAQGDSTRCVHGGEDRSQPGLGGRIDRSASFRLDEDSVAALRAGRPRDTWIYGRYGNPTVQATAERLAALEGAEVCLLAASGMGAMRAALGSLLRPGARVVAARALYGGNLTLLTQGFAPWGVDVELVDFCDLAAVERALGLGAGPRVLVCESVSNPLLRVTDLPRVAELARRAGARLVVDATFATPLVQRPLELGADLVVHSATKMIAGHGDVLGGAVLGRHELVDAVWRELVRDGATPDPEAAFLIDRGLCTLALRLRAQQANAAILADALAAHPAIARVHALTRPDHPDRDVAARVLRGTCPLVAAELAGPSEHAEERALRAIFGLRLATHAASLGDVRTLVSLPSLTSHAGMTAEQRLQLGLRPGLIRISAGIEDAGDLVADFVAALDAVR